MAVLDEVPGIEVTVQIDGQNITEYDDHHISEPDADMNPGCPVMSKYVEAIDDAEFSIKVAVDDEVYAWENTEHRLRAQTTIDGRWVSGPLLKRGDEPRVIEGYKYYSEESQQWYCKKFKFSAISTDGDPQAARIEKDIEAVKDIGLIQVEFGRRVLKSQLKPASSPPLVNTNTLNVAEKALKGKAISHSMSYVIPQTPMLNSLIEDLQFDIIQYMLTHIHIEGLKRELAIPRTPSPEPVTPIVPKFVHNMTIAELQHLAQERLDQIQWAEEAKYGYKSAVKRKANEVVDVDEEADKARAAKRPAVTIDLTDD
ncbi:hypothetical protein F5Y10DRAFT_282747 [Nemania abortiva]|nr:hypothetical protein F5Y10DRAFT_282747 [Nemania abortiva]